MDMVNVQVPFEGDLLITDPCYLVEDSHWPVDGLCGDDINGAYQDNTFLTTATGGGDLNGTVTADEDTIGEYGVDCGMFGVFNYEAIRNLEWFSQPKFDSLPKCCFTWIMGFKGTVTVKIIKQADVDDAYGPLYEIVGAGNFDWKASPL